MPFRTGSAKLLIVLALLMCLGVTGSAVRQAPPADRDFSHQAAVAIAHGQRDEAEKLANARGPADPDAAVVLAQLAEARGKYSDAQARLEPIVARDRSGPAALELALLYRTIGRNADAEPLLEAVVGRAANSSDPYVLYRAGRAAQALNRPKDARDLYGASERAGADPAIVETSWGQLFFEKSNEPEALKSFQTALERDPNWAPAHAGVARVLEDEEGSKAAAEAEKAIAIDPALADAHLILASMHLDADREADAKPNFRRCSPTIPRSSKRTRCWPAWRTSRTIRRRSIAKSRRRSRSTRPTATSIALRANRRRATTGSRRRPTSPGKRWRSIQAAAARRAISACT